MAKGPRETDCNEQAEGQKTGRPDRQMGWGWTDGQQVGCPWDVSCGRSWGLEVQWQTSSIAHRLRYWQTSSWPRPCRQPLGRRREWRRCHTHWTETTSFSSAGFSCWTLGSQSTRWAGPCRAPSLCLSVLKVPELSWPSAFSPCVSRV